MFGDSEAVVTPFMQDGTYPPRNFATFGPSGLQPPFTGTQTDTLYVQFFILQHRAGVRLYTSLLNLAESCVFNKQSPPPLFSCLFSTPSPEVTELICRVPSNIFSHHLSIFYPFTSVRFNTIFKLFYFQQLLNFQRR